MALESLGLFQQGAALRFGKHQTDAVSGHVLVTDEEIERKNRADKDSVEAGFTTLGKYQLNKAGNLLPAIHEGKQQGAFAQGYADEESGQEASGVDQSHPDGDRPAGIEFFGEINQDIDADEVIAAEKTGDRHEAQHRRGDDIH